MLTIRELLRAGQEYDPPLPVIETVLGDPYLYQNNQIYRNIRDSAVALGYEYDGSKGELWSMYQAFSLSTLGWILASRRIPYLDNTSVLFRITRERPELTISPHLLLTALRRNYLLHESAHAVAHAVLADFEHPLFETLGEPEEFAVRGFLGEAFANSVERVGFCLGDERLHALLFGLNSYIPFNRAHVEAIRGVVDSCGISTVFKISFVLFFFSNLSPDPSSLCPFERWPADFVAGASGGISARAFRDLLESGFRVNPRFREETTPFYFDLCGRKDAFEKITAVVGKLRVEDLIDCATMFDSIAGLGKKSEPVRRITHAQERGSVNGAETAVLFSAITKESHL